MDIVSHPNVDPEDEDAGVVVIGSTIGIRAFARDVPRVVAGVATSGLPVILTEHGRPVAAIVPIDRVGDSQRR